MIILIQEYYQSQNEKRANEILDTLINNINNPNIDEIYNLNRQMFTALVFEDLENELFDSIGHMNFYELMEYAINHGELAESDT